MKKIFQWIKRWLDINEPQPWRKQPERKDDGTTNYPTLTNGTIFEESDTGKHYMFDGTSAWNEVK